MADYTTPIETTFELQRRSIKQGHDAMKQGIDFQKRLTESFVGNVDNQEQAQRRLVELHREVVHNALDAVEQLPGADAATGEIRANLEEGYDELLSGHEEAFETLSGELEKSVDSYDELTEELLANVDEQLDALVEAHEELEAQSIEATEELAGQVEELQGQVDDVQEQIQKVSEEAAQAVEA